MGMKVVYFPDGSKTVEAVDHPGRTCALSTQKYLQGHNVVDRQPKMEMFQFPAQETEQEQETK
jgi:hypothetical protein